MLDERLPEEISTSLFMQQVGSDFTLVIRPPSIEYSIPSKNFLFVKTLTREENNDFIHYKFAGWDNQAIACLTKYNKFNELLGIMEKGIDYKVHCARQAAEHFQVPKNPPVIPNKNSRSPPVKRNVAKKFNLSTHQREKMSSPSAMQVFVLNENSGQVSHYSSLDEYRKDRFLEPKNGALRGCFSQNGQLG